MIDCKSFETLPAVGTLIIEDLLNLPPLFSGEINHWSCQQPRSSSLFCVICNVWVCLDISRLLSIKFFAVTFAVTRIFSMINFSPMFCRLPPLVARASSGLYNEPTRALDRTGLAVTLRVALTTNWTVLFNNWIAFIPHSAMSFSLTLPGAGKPLAAVSTLARHDPKLFLTNCAVSHLTAFILLRTQSIGAVLRTGYASALPKPPGNGIVGLTTNGAQVVGALAGCHCVAHYKTLSRN